MRTLFWALALFAIAVAVSLAARYNEGFVILVYPPYRAEVSLNFLICVLVLGFALIYGIARALALACALPGRVREYQLRKKQEKAANVFGDALRLLFEGRYSSALKKAEEASASCSSPAMAALVAARAAQRLREPEKQRVWLEKATSFDSKTESACLMLEAEMLIETGYYAQAIDVLRRLHELSGVHIAALRLELRAHQGAENWDEVVKLARMLEKKKALLPEIAKKIKQKAHQENVTRQLPELEVLRRYLKKIPVSEQTPPIAEAYANALLQAGESDEAETFIQTQLARAWDVRLLESFGKIQGGSLSGRIAIAEKWLVEHPSEPKLLLLIGRLCFAQQLWGKAESYFEAARAVASQPSDQREVSLALARLYEATERSEQAIPLLRAAAALAV